MKDLKTFIRQKFSPLTWVGLIIIGYAVLFFRNVIQPNWVFVGDTLNNFGVYYYQYAGFARGEYPLWNPLVRSGQPEIIHQGMQLANPISNMVMLISVLSGIQSIIFSYAICIFVYIALYVSGVYLLVSCWTNNRYAGVFASFLAIGSSTVFYGTYHVSFILMVHAVPWIFYSFMMYFRTFRFKYLLIFILASISMLYSYEFFLGGAYILMLSVALMFFYYKKLPGVVDTFKKIPLRHIVIAAGILVIAILPNLIIFTQLREKFLVFSRLSNVNLTEQYTLTFQNLFHGRHFSFPIIFSGFWASLFTGVFRNTFESLRHYVGPLTFPFILLALFSKKKIVWCLVLSGILIAMLAGNIFPANLLLELPIFSLIGNAHFLLQFFVLVLIVIAGFGFDVLIQEKDKKVFNAASILLILISFIILFSRFVSSPYNDGILWITIVSILGSLLLVNFCPSRFFIHSFFALAFITTLLSVFWIFHLPMSGYISRNPSTAIVSNRSDYSLQFQYERPRDIETIKLSNESASFGYDEFSSYVTLKDNSYKTAKGVEGGLSTYPVMQSYYLFLFLPWHEGIMSKKFFFFPRSYISDNPKQMIAFRDVRVLSAMLAQGIGIVDKLKNTDISLGPFYPESAAGLVNKTFENKWDVHVTEY